MIKRFALPLLLLVLFTAATVAQSPITAMMDVSPMQVAPGGTVQVDFSVTNTGTKAIHNVTVYLAVYSECDRNGDGLETREDGYYLHEETNGPMTMRAGQVFDGGGERLIVIPDPAVCDEYYAYLVVRRNIHGYEALFRDIYIIP